MKYVVVLHEDPHVEEDGRVSFETRGVYDTASEAEANAVSEWREVYAVSDEQAALIE